MFLLTAAVSYLRITADQSGTDEEKEVSKKQ